MQLRITASYPYSRPIDSFKPRKHAKHVQSLLPLAVGVPIVVSEAFLSPSDSLPDCRRLTDFRREFAVRISTLNYASYNDRLDRIHRFGGVVDDDVLYYLRPVDFHKQSCCMIKRFLRSRPTSSSSSMPLSATTMARRQNETVPSRIARALTPCSRSVALTQRRPTLNNDRRRRADGREWDDELYGWMDGRTSTRKRRRRRMRWRTTTTRGSGFSGSGVHAASPTADSR